MRKMTRSSRWSTSFLIWLEEKKEKGFYCVTAHASGGISQTFSRALIGQFGSDWQILFTSDESRVKNLISDHFVEYWQK